MRRLVDITCVCQYTLAMVTLQLSTVFIAAHRLLSGTSDQQLRVLKAASSNLIVIHKLQLTLDTVFKSDKPA